MRSTQSDADEALAIEAHLAECPRCRAEVDVHFEMAGAIGNTVESPPAGLWDRIADRLAAPAGWTSRHRCRTWARATRRRLLSERRRIGQGRRGWPMPVPTKPPVPPKLSMRVSAVVAAAQRWWSSRSWRSTSPGRQPGWVRSRAPLADRALRPSSVRRWRIPKHRLANLKGATGEKLAEFVVTPDGRGYLVSSSMPSLPASRPTSCGHSSVASPSLSACREPAQAGRLYRGRFGGPHEPRGHH